MWTFRSFRLGTRPLSRISSRNGSSGRAPGPDPGRLLLQLRRRGLVPLAEFLERLLRARVKVSPRLPTRLPHPGELLPRGLLQFVQVVDLPLKLRARPRAEGFCSPAELLDL